MNTQPFKRFFIAPIQAYQYISRMLPGSCRYYPTCSEYAKWQFIFDAPHRALIRSTLRIARCNQLFPGGIDYPVVRWNPPGCPFVCRHSDPGHIAFWLIPKNPQEYFVLKTI